MVSDKSLQAPVWNGLDILLNKRTPKACLLSWLPEPRPQGGPRKRWRDVIGTDLKDMQIPEDTWYVCKGNNTKGRMA